MKKLGRASVAGGFIARDAKILTALSFLLGRNDSNSCCRPSAVDDRSARRDPL
jgi:hypothetical protein